MDDQQLIELLWERSELALYALQRRYGRLALKLAKNLLHDPRDVEECISDALLAVWKSVPPERPISLQAYFCRIVKNQAMKRVRCQTAEKRIAVLLPLEELADCGKDLTEEMVDAALLGKMIRAYLFGVTKDKRIVFILRYWYHTPIAEIARSCGFSQSKVTSMLLRMRRELSEMLKKEGFLP